MTDTIEAAVRVGMEAWDDRRGYVPAIRAAVVHALGAQQPPPVGELGGTTAYGQEGYLRVNGDPTANRLVWPGALGGLSA